MGVLDLFRRKKCDLAGQATANYAQCRTAMEPQKLIVLLGNCCRNFLHGCCFCLLFCSSLPPGLFIVYLCVCIPHFMNTIKHIRLHACVCLFLQTHSKPSFGLIAKLTLPIVGLVEGGKIVLQGTISINNTQ